jgi:hypothetical protein
VERATSPTNPANHRVKPTRDMDRPIADRFGSRPLSPTHGRSRIVKNPLVRLSLPQPPKLCLLLRHASRLARPSLFPSPTPSPAIYLHRPTPMPPKPNPSGCVRHGMRNSAGGSGSSAHRPWCRWCSRGMS